VPGLGCHGRLLLSAVALAGSLVTIVLMQDCCSMFRAVRDAHEELRHPVQQFYDAAMSAKGLEPARTRSASFGLLQEIAD